MRRRIPMIVLFAVALLSACTSDGGGGSPNTVGATTTMVPAGAPVRSVVLGSSTAAGWGPSDRASAWVERYRAHLQSENPGHEVVNLAVPAYTTFHLLPTGTEIQDGRPAPDGEANVTAALAQAPDAVIVNLPSNDTAVGIPVDEQIANFARIVEAAERESVAVWIASTQPRNLDAAGRAAQVAVLDALLATYGDRALDFWAGLATSDDGIDPALDHGDGIHLNDEGHRILFERVRDADIPGVLALSLVGSTR